MKEFTTIAVGLAALTLTVWAFLKHRKSEVAQYPLSWRGWVTRLALVGFGFVLMLVSPGHIWGMFAGCAFIVMPLMLRQIPYEIETRCFPRDSVNTAYRHRVAK